MKNRADVMIGGKPVYEKLTEVYAVVAHQEGKEGIPAMNNGPDGMMLPLVGAVGERALASFRRSVEIMKQYADEGVRFELVKFTTREHVEWM